MTRLEYYDAVKEKYNISKDKRNILLIGTPNHGNLGDHAIAYATLKLLSDMFPNDQITEINMYDFPFDIDAVYHSVKQEDMIILQGGGNLGNVYMDDEMIRRYVIARFTENKIIMFPQSAYFSDDLNGAEELETSSKIYGANQNLYLIARDKKTETFLKENFQNRVYRLPDVVLTMPSCNTPQKRDGVLLCLRNDKEKVTAENTQKHIADLLREKNYKTEVTDTVIEYNADQFDRMEELNKKWDEFSHAELVITDRLHGVIFSAITETPCIALPDFNGKISGVLDDLNGINNIVFLTCIEKLDDVIQTLIKSGNSYQNKQNFKKYKSVLNELFSFNPDDFHYTASCTVSDVFRLSGYWNNQYYEQKYWKTQITDDYEKLKKNKGEQEKELAIYQEWVKKLGKKEKDQKTEYQHLEAVVEEKVKELDVYKSWVDNLEDQISKSKIEYTNMVENNNAKDKELDEYKKWVNNLQEQISENKIEYANIVNINNEQDLKLAEYKDWINNLQEQIKELNNKLELNIMQMAEKEKQWNIRQRELYNWIKNNHS